MILQALAPLRIRLNGVITNYEPGSVFTVTPEQAQRLLERAQGRLRALDLPLDPPVEPLQPGWLVAYRDRRGALCGGCDDRANGTVASCDWSGSSWLVRLTSGDTLPLGRVVSVGKTDAAGRIISAWTVRAHGYDGEGRTS